MQEKLLRGMLVCSVLFFAVSMGVMLYYSSTKAIVIAEEVAPESERASEHMQEKPLAFEDGEAGEGILIPLPAQLRADDIAIENRYIERTINIILTGKYGTFYSDHPIGGSDGRVKEGSYSESDGVTRLQLKMTGVYEHEYVFGDGVLQLSFMEPGKVYDRIVVLDAEGGEASGEHVRERDVTLEIAEDVKNKLEQADIRVYFTRMDDTGVPPEECALFANELNADLLVSVRTGKDERDSSIFGISSYYNSLYFIPYFGNAQLADLLEREVVTEAGGKANGLFEAEGDQLLGNVRMPAAAVEVGYLTNSEEEAFLGASEYREKLATGIVNAVRKAFEMQEQAR